MGAPNGPLPGGKGDTAPPHRRSSSSRPQQSSPARSTTKPPPLPDSPPSPLPSPTSLKHRRVPELKHRSQQGTQTDLLLAAVPPANETATPTKKLLAGVIPTPAPVPTCQDSASTGHAASDPDPMAAPGLDEVMAFLTDYGFARAASALRDDVRARTAAVLDPQLPPLRMPGSVSGGGDTPASGSPRSSFDSSLAASSACPGLPSRSYADVVRAGGCLATGSVGQRPPPATGHSKRVKFNSHTDSVKFSVNLPPAQSLWRCSKAPCCNIQQEIHSILKKTSAARSSLFSVLSEPAMKPSSFGNEQQQLDISDPSSKQINIISSSPTSIQPRSEQSLIFKKWARGRCYRCLAHDHQVRSCKNFFRCIRCGGTGHRERYCRTLPASPRVLYNEGLQHNQSAQGHQQILQVDPPSQGHQSKVPSSSYASAVDLVSKSVVVSWLETLRSDLERMIETHLERMMSPIREELSTIKLWLARVASHLECRGQERDLSADGSGSNIAELFGPLSPVRFSSSTAMFDSLAAAFTSVNPSVCEGANVDMTETNPAAETAQEMPSEQTIEVSTVVSTAQIPGDPQKKQLVIQADSQVEDTIIAEDACDVEIISPSRMIVVNPCKEVMTEGPYPTDSSPLGVTVAKRDESQVLSSVRKVASTRCARKLFGKTTLRRSRCPSPRNFLKDLGFIKKNGKLDEEKLEAFGDLLKDLLPPDLLLSLMSLKGRAFWKAIAKIFDPFC